MMRKLLAEGLGTAFLLIAVVGSGIMAEALSGGSVGLALLANAIATGCALYVLITIFGPVSGAHFNPAVTLVFLILGETPPRTAAACIVTQIAAWNPRRLDSPPDVRTADPATQHNGQDRSRSVERRPDRHIRAGADHPWGGALPARVHPHAGGSIYHRGILVHRLDKFRQSGGDHCAQLYGYFRRDSCRPMPRPSSWHNLSGLFWQFWWQA